MHGRKREGRQNQLGRSLLQSLHTFTPSGADTFIDILVFPSAARTQGCFQSTCVCDICGRPAITLDELVYNYICKVTNAHKNNEQYFTFFLG